MQRTASLLFVIAMHATALWALWPQRLFPSSQDTLTLFVNFIIPPAPERQEKPKRPPQPNPTKPKLIEKPQPPPNLVPLVTEAPVVETTDYVAPPPRLEPTPAIEVLPAQLPPGAIGPIALNSELAFACPERSAPAYPAPSRRIGEEGTVVLRVELDEQGNISAARIATSSGFMRLDEAALAAVRTWHCSPATRNGQPVRAVALQPFKFVLQGN